MISWSLQKLRVASRAARICAALIVLQSIASAQQMELRGARDRFEGQVVGQNGNPISGAEVTAYVAGVATHTARADGAGHFRFDGLAKALQTTKPTPRYYFFAAQAPGLVAVPVAVDPFRDEPVKIVLSPPADLKVRVVTTDDQPIIAANLEPVRFTMRYSNGGLVSANWRSEPLPPFAQQMMEQRAVTDEKGVATLTGLPSHGELQLWLRRSEFADLEHLVPLGQGEATLRMSRETVIEGRVTLADGRVLPSGALFAKAQTWTYPYHHRTGTLDENGFYRIGEVSSLELLGEETLGMNLTKPPTITELAPGITAFYAPSGYDLTVSIAQDGRVEHWIAYVEAAQRGFTYREGEQVRRDLVLQPLAVVRGRILSGEKTPLHQMIRYEDPRTIYGPRHVTCRPDGSFELLVPPGDVRLHFGGTSHLVEALKPHEVRHIEVKRAD